MATLKDISNMTGVSQGAVSRILNNDEKLSVSDETREKVLRAAEELNYTSVSQRHKMRRYPDKRTGTLKTIGVAQMFDNEALKEDVYYLLMKNMLDEECFAKGYVTTTLFRDAAGSFSMNGVQKIDGLIAVGRFTSAEIRNFEKYTSNIVFIDSSPDEMKYNSVVPNYHMAIRLALRYFRKMGHSSVAYIGATKTFNGKKNLSTDARYYYYKNYTTEREFFDDEHAIDCEMTPKSAYKAMCEYIEKNGRPPKALFMASDVLVPGVIKALSEHNFTIPNDVSVVTYNNTNLSKQSIPPLDSIEVYMQDNAAAAVTCMEQLWGERRLPKKIVIPCSLEIRGSVTEASAPK